MKGQEGNRRIRNSADLATTNWFDKTIGKKEQHRNHWNFLTFEDTCGQLFWF